MSLYDWREERFIRKVLRRLSHQRVGLILQPGNVWVLENSLPGDDRTDSALRTCHLRGWVEVLERAVPVGTLTKEGKLPEGDVFTGVGPMYRLTEGGWAMIYGTHDWLVVTCVVACATLVATIAGIIMFRLNPH